MKKIITFALILSLLLLTGCGDKEAREYAGKLAEVLTTYQAQVVKKIKAEQQYYQNSAQIYSTARRQEIISTLNTERLNRIDRLADSLMQGAKLSPSEIHKLIADYAKLDFDSTRIIYEKESDDTAEYLTGVENLQLQAASINALVKALQSLSEEKGSLSQLKSVVDFAGSVKSRLNVLECEDLAREVVCLGGIKKSLTGEKTLLTMVKATLIAAKDSATIPEEKIKIQQQINETDGKLNALLAKLDKLQLQIDSLTEQMKTKGCNETLLTTVKCTEK